MDFGMGLKRVLPLDLYWGADKAVVQIASIQIPMNHLLDARAPELSQSKIAQYENHHDNKTNDRKNIHVRFTSLSRDQILFNLQVDLE
jgi:hypothetical protein